MKAGVLAVIALGAIVWGFALIGIFSVAEAIGPTAIPTPVPLLAQGIEADEAVGIAGLPVHPGARRSEVRQDQFGAETVTEVEYLVDSSARQIRGHYRDALARHGWTVTDTSWTGDAWTYTVTRGGRHGIVQILQRSGVTEVEIEIAEAIAARGGLTDR